jgi:uncharacterized membrane protein ArfB
MIALQRLRAIEFRYWVLAAYGWGALAVTLLPAGTPVRVAVVYLFVLTGPGFVLSALMVDDAAERWVLTIALSVALAILVSVAMTAVRNDSMPLRMAVLAAVNTVAALLWGMRAGRADPPARFYRRRPGLGWLFGGSGRPSRSPATTPQTVGHRTVASTSQLAKEFDMDFVIQWLWYLLAFVVGSLVAWLITVITIRRTSDDAFADLPGSREVGAR